MTLLYHSKFTLRNKMTEKIKLEEKVNFPREITNSVSVEDNGNTIKYVGTAFNLWVDWSDNAVRGNAQMSKYQSQTGIKTEVRFLRRWLPIPISIKKVPIEKQRLIWKVEEDWHEYFISEGETQNNCIGLSGYRCSLVEKASFEGIKISPKLLDMIFNPIDKRIMEEYQKAVKNTD